MAKNKFREKTQKNFLKVKLFLKIDCLLGRNGKKQVPRKNSKKIFESETFFEDRLSIRSEWQETSSEKKLKKIFLK